MGARGMGMASVVANPDDLISAFYYNPAGLARIKGENIAVGSGFVYLPFKYQNSEGYSQPDHMIAPMPFFGYSTDKAQPVVLGIGLFSTLGVGFDFEKDPAHGIYDDIESSAGVLYVSPTLAYRINPRLAVGFELNIGYGMAEINQPLRHPVTGTPLGGYLETKSDGFGYGFTVGLLYEITPSLTMGLNWRSPMKTSLEGDAKFAGQEDDFELDFYWPQMVSLGLAYKPNPRLTLSVSTKWADWTYFDRSKFLRFERERFTQFNGPLFDDSRDTMQYLVGLEYWHNKDIVLRIGYKYDQYSIDSKYLSPLVADVDDHMFFGGIGIQWNKWQAHLFCCYAVPVERKNEESLVGYPNGEVSGYAPVPGFEINYRF